MKGYELYSWQERGQWRFTLITGTNRNKNLEEIISGKNGTTGDGWVDLHVTGVDALKAILSRLPSGEFVSWSNSNLIIKEGSENPFTIPPADIVSRIKQYAEEGGLDFQSFQ
jgi:hypothetical protein